jgi:hypothetical protein
LNITRLKTSYQNGDKSGAQMPHKNERVELEMKIMKYRQMAVLAVSDELTRQRIRNLIAELEQKLRDIDA